MLVVIGSMPMGICNHFHERLANNGKITTFCGGTAFRCSRAQVLLNPEDQDLDHRNLRSMLKKFHTQLVYVYFNWVWRSSLLKCVSQPEIANRYIKTPILAFKVVQRH